MRLLDAADVATCLAHVDPVEQLRHAFRLRASGRTVLPPEYGLRWNTLAAGHARSLGLPAFLGGDTPVAGVKIINASSTNLARGWPRASGLILLFDPESARIRCILDAAQISAFRTAAVSSLAEELVRGHRPIEHVALVGAGPLAAAHLRVLVPRLPRPRVVRIFDLDPARADALAQRYAVAAAEDIAVESGAMSLPALATSDLVITVTTTQEPYIERGDVKPGAVIINVSLDDVGPGLLLGADRLFVDDWTLVSDDEHRLLGKLHRQGRVVGPHDAVTGSVRHVDAELADLVAGTVKGRTHDDDVIIVNPFGMAIGDVALAAAVEGEAVERGLGTGLPGSDRTAPADWL